MKVCWEQEYVVLQAVTIPCRTQINTNGIKKSARGGGPPTIPFCSITLPSPSTYPCQTPSEKLSLHVCLLFRRREHHGLMSHLSTGIRKNLKRVTQWLSSVLRASLQPPSSDTLTGFRLPSTSRTINDLTPLSASDFFAQALEVIPPDNPSTFRVYLSPPTKKQGDKGTYMICHHGGGASGLSFAALAKDIREKGDGELGVVAFDCRGHGESFVDH